MLMFSLGVHPLAKVIAKRTQLGLHRGYADDCTLIGTHAELEKAIDFLCSKGPDHGLFLNPAITRIGLYRPRQPVIRPTPLLRSFARENFSDEEIDLLGAPIGSRQYMEGFRKGKLDDCIKTLSLIDGIGDARIRFHLHRVCASACKLKHVEKLAPQSATSDLAQRFDSEQME